MVKTTVVSATMTVRNKGKALAFNATRVLIPTSGPTAGRRISITADRTDPSWDALNILSRADVFKGIIREAARARGWKIFIPEISTRTIIIGFHDTIAVDDGITFVEEIGITQNQPMVKRLPKKRTRG